MQEESQDRRRSKRIRYPCEARCYGVGETIKAHLSDVSLTGAFIETTTELPLSSIVLLRFVAEGERVKAEAEVVRNNPPHGWGVRFLSLEPRSRAVIEKIGAAE